MTESSDSSRAQELAEPLLPTNNEENDEENDIEVVERQKGDVESPPVEELQEPLLTNQENGHVDIEESAPVQELCDRPWWRFTHALGFCAGGVLFTIGTLLYYPAIYDAHKKDMNEVALLGAVTAWLYVVGSLGFLYVDVQEFFTFKEPTYLRINIACSMFGSTLYVIGSAGFLPNIYSWTPLVGILGFIGGSLSIGCSQTWKLYRILSTSVERDEDDEVSLRRAYSERNNAAFVEGGAMVGGFCFLVGTMFYWRGPIEGDQACVVTCRTYELVLALWVLGSLAFLFGGLSLAWRHAVLKIT